MHRTFPFTRHLSGYGRRALRPDAISGLTVAALALPSGMAYAELAGLSPVAGLYALLLPVLAYVVFGSSRQLVVGPEATLALLVVSIVGPLADGDAIRYAELAAMLALITGGLYLVARLVRLGWIADYFSRPVLVGYIHGVAIVLIIGQLGKLLGISIEAQDPIPQLVELLGELSTTSAATVAVSAVSLIVLLVLRRFVPRVPGPLVVVIGGIAASALLSLESYGVATVGEIPAGLPQLSVPDVGLQDVLALLPGAVGIFAVGFADGVLTARSFAGRRGQYVSANQELVALGAANAAAGLTQAFPVGASGSRTAVNDQMGGRTQLVGLFSAITIAIVLLFLTAPVALLPKACLGAVIVVAAIGLISREDWRGLAHVGRSQVLIAAVTMVGVLTVGVLQALVVAVALSILDIVVRSAKPHDAVLGWVERLGRYGDASLHPSARLTPGVLVYRLDDKLFFANSRYFSARVLEAVAAAPTPTRWIVFDAEGVPDIDASGIEALELLIAQLRRSEISFAVARLKTPLLALFDRSGLTEAVGPENFYPNVERAVQACAEHAATT